MNIESNTVMMKEVALTALLQYIKDIVEESNTRKQVVVVDEKKPLSPLEAAEFTGLAKQTIYKFTSEGNIPHHKRGGKLWFFRDELVAWIKGRSVNNVMKLR